MPQSLSYLLHSSMPSPAPPARASARAVRQGGGDGGGDGDGGTGEGGVMAALNSVADEVDFGTIAVYTCTASCEGGAAWGAREHVHVQLMSGVAPRRRGQAAAEDEGERADGTE